ncbi:hypothetical protein TRFO_33754 [Tritrichomonas foetus]|uniref:Uncharacterized protein n=1 Tax=Tritrichomonas foetus TaxID=1144522 RepID=A0A1J4JQF3_9EUKA|nr:hypothetical protein TRFO_33754 [Tritrichomonas foetus]|eukprot:OHS99757.1 hypothetical protein TRFO_33754 [Tritrichomonas foetus]
MKFASAGVQLFPSDFDFDQLINFSCGSNCCVYIKKDGNVYGIGNNFDGKIGLPKRGLFKNPLQIDGLSDIKSVKCGYNGYTLFLKNDGTVYIASFETKTPFVKVPINEKCVSIHGSVTPYAIGESNTIYEISLDGQNTKQHQIQPNQKIIEIVSIENNTSILLAENGILYGRGEVLFDVNCKNREEFQVIPQFANEKILFQKISGFKNHLLALTFRNEIYVWGDNKSGQLGIGNNINVKELFIKLPNFSQPATIQSFSTGDSFSVFLDSNHCVWTTGYNYYGQLMLIHKKNVLSPTKTALRDIKEVYCGQYSTLYQKSEFPLAGGNFYQISTQGKNQKILKKRKTNFRQIYQNQKLYDIMISSNGIHNLTNSLEFNEPIIQNIQSDMNENNSLGNFGIVDKLYDNFQIIIDEEIINMPRILADFISPTISHLYRVDPTISTFKIDLFLPNFLEQFKSLLNYENKSKQIFYIDNYHEYYRKILHYLQKLAKGEKVKMNELDLIVFEIIAEKLGNEVLLRIIQSTDNKSTSIHQSTFCDSFITQKIDNIFDKIRFEKSFYTKIHQSTKNFICSNFYILLKTHLSDLKRLGSKELSEILFENKLVLEDEDSFMGFMYDLIEEEGSTFDSSILEYIEYRNVSQEMFSVFLNHFSFNFMTNCLWKKIGDLLILAKNNSSLLLNPISKKKGKLKF